MPSFGHGAATQSPLHARISGGFPHVLLAKDSSRSHAPYVLTRRACPPFGSSHSLDVSGRRKVFTLKCHTSSLKITNLCAQLGTSSCNSVEDQTTPSGGRPQSVENPKVLNPKKSSNSHKITSLSASSTPSIKFLSSVQLPSVEQLFFLAGLLSCVALAAFLAVLATAIPTLRSMRNAAMSMERLANIAIQELPSTMAAMRLSSMEISDLTLELHDLSQEISDGVKSSARAVKAAEVGIRQMGTIAASQTLAILQEGASVPVAVVKPVVASAAQSTRQAVAQAQRAVANIASNPNTLGWFRKITQKGQSEANIVGVLEVKPKEKTKSISDVDKTDRLPVDLQ